jgi:peptidyl-prolyl cis-trans isomerase A (cyclophilin A)
MTYKKLAFILVALFSITTAQAQTNSDRTRVYVDTVLGGFTIELYDDIAPNTVTNFLNYVRDSDYDGTFFHRLDPGFVLQGGGYFMESDNSGPFAVPQDDPIANEFRLSNIRGTIAMARPPGNPNSATNQWFINLTDNSSLDSLEGGYTVFAKVIGNGMDVVDLIEDLTTYDAGGAFSELPMINFSTETVARENLVNINSMSVIESTLTSTGTATPASVQTGASVLFTVTVTPGTNPVSTGIAVTADLSSIGGSATQTFFDDGTNGDVTSGDNVFSYLATVPTGVTSGTASINVSVSDAISRTGTTSLALTVSTGQTFSISDRGGVSFSSEGTSATTVSGYGRVEADDGSTTPAGLAIFGFRQNGILVSEAGVPASATVQEGRVFAEIDGPVRTGLAIANPNDSTVTIWFVFTDANGVDFGADNFTLGPMEQTANFLDESPFNGVEPLLGSFTFSSNLPISVIALRGFTNERSEFLMTTLPVAPLTASTADTIYFPHFADGAGWTTQVILVNPTNSPITGRVQFFDTGSETVAAQPASLTLDDAQVGSEFTYSIPKRTSTRLRTANPAGATQVGSIRVIADSESSVPSGVGVFSFENAGVTVSEAGVPASAPGAAFRVYVEASGISGQPGSIRSGLAITNTSEMATLVFLKLIALDGTATGLSDSITIPASGQVARFIDEVFPSLTIPFSGILRITSTATNIALVGLRLTTNERNDFLITTTPPSDESSATSSTDLFFPHFVDSGGWTTQFILFSGSAGQISGGTLRFTAQNGEDLDLSVSSTSTEETP